MSENSMFPTIRQTARRMGMSEYELRKGVKEGRIPYIMSGNRVKINIAMLIDILNAESANRLNADKKMSCR